MHKLLQVLFVTIITLLVTSAIGQTNLPVGFSTQELLDMQRPDYQEAEYQPKVITSPPPGSLRNMAQWEEVQGFTITWRSYQSQACEKDYFVNTFGISKGAYLLVIETGDKRATQKLMIR